jgi:hypothetical protein
VAIRAQQLQILKPIIEAISVDMVQL